MLTAEDIFERWFLPLYPPDARADLAKARATDANPAKNPSVLAHLDEAAAVFAARGAELFGEDLGLDCSDASVQPPLRASALDTNTVAIRELEARIMAMSTSAVTAARVNQKEAGVFCSRSIR